MADDAIHRLRSDNSEVELIACEADAYNELSSSGGVYTTEVSDLSPDLRLVDDTSTVLEVNTLDQNDHNEEQDGQLPNSPSRRKRLDFKSLGLYGRRSELEKINSSYDRLCNGEVKRLVVLLSGKSGAGKTRIAQEFREMARTKSRNALYLRGKFDSSSYSGIASAMSQICGKLQELSIDDPERFALIQRQIRDVGTELELLIQVIPVLEEIATEGQPARPFDDALTESTTLASPNRTRPPSAPMVNAKSKQQLCYAFTRFIRVITNEFQPLVIVLDDLHQADASSMELLEALVTDQGIDNLLVVGIYRTNEVDSSHLMRKFIQDLGDIKDEDFGLTEVEIAELDKEAVHEIIISLLGQTVHNDDYEARTSELATVCFEKTLGNAFFLLQFISILVCQRLLRFDFDMDAWVWDVQEIKASTRATDNVVDLLKAQMSALSAEQENLKLILQLAACFGSSFPLSFFKTVWTNLPQVSSLNEEHRDYRALEEGLGVLERHNLIVSNSTAFPQASSYSWCHDKIQEAAISLVSQSDWITFGRCVGNILISRLGQFDSMFLLAVNLLNDDSQSVHFNDRLELARLNFEASRKSISLLSFENAAEYARKGIKLLPYNKWQEQPELALKLYSSGAKAESLRGNVETMYLYCREVMNRTDQPITAKFDAYTAYIDSIRSQGRVKEAALTLIDVLSNLKCSFPENTISVHFRTLCHIIWIAATVNSRDLSNLPRMQDMTKIEIMKLLDKLATSFYMIHDDRLALVVFRSLNWTLKYGYSDYSPVAFAATGIVLTGVVGDLQAGSKYGEKALTLLKKTKSTETAARTMFYVHAFVFPFTKPANDILAPLLEAHESGLKSGDAECACWAIYNWSIMKFLIGCPLSELEANLRSYSKTIEDMKGEHAFYVSAVSRFVRQVYLNLMGRDNFYNPEVLTGAANDRENLRICEIHPALKPGVQAYYGMILTYFGRHQRQADWILGLDQSSQTNVANPEQMWENFLRGLSCFAAARQTNDKKYLKLATKFRSKIKTWVSNGNPNVVHFDALLDAESLAVKGKVNAAITCYQRSISLAEERGCQHDAALACERLCDYHCTVTRDYERARIHFEKAQEHWTNWGARAVVSHLERKYSRLRLLPSELRIEFSVN